MDKDLYHIAYIKDAFRKIHQYSDDLTLEQFIENEEKQSALAMQLIAIGAEVKKLSDEFKSQYDLPWRQIAGFRDVAVHNYYSLDPEILWKTLQERIPEMEQALSESKSLANNP